MIGVLAAPSQSGAVEEFFELFKTPWEPWRAGQAYDVVIATADAVADLDARLLIVCGSAKTTLDDGCGIRIRAVTRESAVSADGVPLPVYGPVATFDAPSAARVVLDGPDGPAAIELIGSTRRTVRIGFDLFDEVARLLSAGQPIRHAAAPTLDAHVALVRGLIVAAKLPFLEIPPMPFGHPFAVSLTHDIDFVGIRRHVFDHSVAGFLYRSTVGAVVDVCRGRISFERLIQRWKAVASLPLVYAGLMGDFWEPFAWYLRVEKRFRSTYFLIPFKRRAGERVASRHAARRATAYDVEDIRPSTAVLATAGCELAVHGIDAWHSDARGREELDRVAGATGSTSKGIRMHWLLWDSETPRVLERAGYEYDSTAGYNETVGYRNGTTQVFRPTGAVSLLELPMHIQDGALFYPKQLDLSEHEADERCGALIRHVREAGGVLTVLWHDRSHGPERFWGEFYERLVQRLEAEDPWFGTAGEIVDWFRRRRAVRFGAADVDANPASCLKYEGEEIVPPLRVRVHDAQGSFVETAWNGRRAAVGPMVQPQQVMVSL